MSDEEITPIARPCLNPENRGLAEAISHNRYAVEGFAKRLGDLERTIRLSAEKYGIDVKERLAGIQSDFSDEMKRAAQETRESK